MTVLGWGGGQQWRLHSLSPTQELDWKNSVRAATTAALPANTASPDGLTLTADADGAFPAIDTVPLVVGDRFLLKDEAASDPKHGLWFLEDAGSPTSPWVVRRTADADTDAKFSSGLTVEVEEGANNAGTYWYVSTPDPIILGTTPVTFTELPVTPLAALPPVNVTKAPAAAGTATTAARRDHKHDVDTAAAGTIAVGDTALEGTAASLARSDHRHAMPPPGAPVNVTKSAAGAGSATTAARADHKHDVTTAAPVTATGSNNSEGTATTIARSDHRHRLEVQAQDDGAAIGQRPTFNFTGAGVTVTDDGANDRINVDIPGGGGGVATQIPSNYVQLSAPITTTSAVLADMAGVVVTVTLTSTAHIHGVMTFAARSADPGGGAIYGAWAVQINSVDGQEVQRYLSGATDDGVGAVQFRTSSPLPPGTYTIKGRFRRVSGLRVLETFSAQLFAWGIEGGGVPTKEVFLAATDYDSAALGNYRSKSQLGTTDWQYTFKVPHDFNSLVGMYLVGVATVLPGSGAGNYVLNSDYCQKDEPFANHSETQALSAATLFTVANDMTEVDISGVFSALAAGDYCGIEVQHNAIGTTIFYLGIRLRYT